MGAVLAKFSEVSLGVVGKAREKSDFFLKEVS